MSPVAMTSGDSGPTSHSFTSQRLKLHYVDWGNEDAPPLLMIHGGRDHCRNWDWVARRMRDRFHILALDLRGHGESGWAIGGAYNQVSYIGDIAQLVHQKIQGPTTIMAHSLGAVLTLLYAGIFPETIRKIVAIEGVPPMDMVEASPVEERLRGWIETRRQLSGRPHRR